MRYAFKLNVLFNNPISSYLALTKTKTNLWNRQFVVLMEGISEKKNKAIEIKLANLSSLKRVADLFPKGLTTETSQNDLPSDLNQVVTENLLTKSIPNLAGSALPVIPKNSISVAVSERNAQLAKDSQNQVQSTFIKRFKPLNIVTIVLFVGWIVTATVLGILY